MNTKEFHLGDVLSITTGRLVSPRHITGVYDILDFMTGDSLATNQLRRASGECKPYLFAQFPQLMEVNTTEVNAENYKQWLADQVVKYGEMFAVKPIPKNAHEIMDPVTELVEMVGGTERIIVI